MPQAYDAVVDELASGGAPTGAGEGGAALDSDEPQPAAEVPRGTMVGRYVVVDVLGAGAMGVVYAAYDPELMRQVALKVLHPRVALVQDPAAAGARLQREAQALAKLSHRNVVAVYDVGNDRGRVYLAMELVRGGNLRHWLGLRPRPWSEVLPVLLAAGRGLAAAHAHGLVHRDFKPENVIIGDHDSDRSEPSRVCVTDFGLARAEAGASSDAGGGALAMTLTREGDTIGTPAYMAPEQHVGACADARADQYAFCVVLYEAIYGQRPFTGEGAAELSLAKHAGDLRPADRSIVPDPAGRTWPVPSWLRAIVRRGLAIDPADRFADMDALLAALARDHDGRRRRQLVVAVVASVAIAVLVAFALGGRETPCAEAGQLPGGWGPDARAAITRTFVASDRARADALSSWAVAKLDDAATEWASVHRELCAATWIHGEQSPELLDVRMACMQRVWTEIVATATVLGQADASVVDHAPTSIVALPRAAECRRSVPTSGTVVDADHVAAIAALERDLVEARVRVRAGRDGDVDTAVLLARGRELGAPRLLAELSLLRAQLVDGASARALVEAALATIDAQAEPRLAAELWIALARAVSGDRDELEAHFYGSLALAELERLGEQPELVGAAHDALAGALVGLGRFDEALEHARRAESSWVASAGAEHPALPAVWLHHARALAGLQRPAEARALLERVLAREPLDAALREAATAALVELAREPAR